MTLYDIRNLIAQGDTANALKALVGRIQEGAGRNERLRDDILILSNRYQDLKRKETLGLLDRDDAVRENAQVNEALLNLIAELESGPHEPAPQSVSGAKNEPWLKRHRIVVMWGALAVVGVVLWIILSPPSPLPPPLPPPTVQSKPLPCGKNPRPNIDTVFIQGGIFTMGAEPLEHDEIPHEVTVNSFYIDKHEVTNEEYAAFLNAVGAYDTSWIDFEKTYQEEQCRVIQVDGRYTVKSGYEKHPVVCVNWEGAMAFACYYGMRLPTEAEWEYAARGGKKGVSHNHAYAGSNKLDEVGWSIVNGKGQIRAVAQKVPNEAGLYDMSGNLYEWCSDYYHAKYYAFGPKNNPENRDSTNVRVVRGGNVFFPDAACRSANRGVWAWKDNNVGIGFRCVRAF